MHQLEYDIAKRYLEPLRQQTCLRQICTLIPLSEKSF